MVKQLKLKKIGGSIATTLPKDMMDRLKVGPGDTIFAIETERGILLTPYRPELERGMQAYEYAAKKFRNALRELADK